MSLIEAKGRLVGIGTCSQLQLECAGNALKFLIQHRARRKQANMNEKDKDLESLLGLLVRILFKMLYQLRSLVPQ